MCANAHVYSSYINTFCGISEQCLMYECNFSNTCQMSRPTYLSNMSIRLHYLGCCSICSCRVRIPNILWQVYVAVGARDMRVTHRYFMITWKYPTACQMLDEQIFVWKCIGDTARTQHTVCVFNTRYGLVLLFHTTNNTQLYNACVATPRLAADQALSIKLVFHTPINRSMLYFVRDIRTRRTVSIFLSVLFSMTNKNHSSQNNRKTLWETVSRLYQAWMHPTSWN